MRNNKKAKILGSLCLVAAFLTLIIGILYTTLGYLPFRFYSDIDAPLSGLWLTWNSVINLFSRIIYGLPLYCGLAGYYFYGAVGNKRLAKFLFGILIIAVGLDLFFDFCLFVSHLLIDLEVITRGDDLTAGRFMSWFYSITATHYYLTLLLPIAFGLAALIEKKVTMSIRLVPIFAGFCYLLILYPTSLSAITKPDFVGNLIYLGLIGFYFYGAIGKNLWAKILFGVLSGLIILNVAFELIIFSINFLKVFEIDGEMHSSIIFEWFLSLKNIKYILLPIISITFGITSLFVERRNIALQLIPVLAGVLCAIYYAIFYFFPGFEYFGYSDEIRDLFSISNQVMTEMVWGLIGIAVLRTSKLISPFLAIVLVLSSLHIFVLILIDRPYYLGTYGIIIYVIFISSLIQIFFTYYMWSAIDDGKTKIKPWLAIGLGVIPVFSFFWNLFLYGKFPQSFNAYIDRNNLETTYISASPFILYIVFSVLVTIAFLIPYLGLLLSLLFLIIYLVLIFKTCNAIARLSTENESNDSSSLTLNA